MRGVAQRLVQSGAVEAELMSAAVSRFGDTPNSTGTWSAADW